MELLKDVVDSFATPLAIALILGVLALLGRALRRSGTSLALALTASAIAYLGSIEATADLLLAPLERKYEPLQLQSAAGVRHIVVLGSGYLPRAGIPVTAALDDDGLTRIVEGIRLTRLLQIPNLIVSGGVPGTPGPAAGYAELARDLGIDAASIQALEARDTRAEAAAVIDVLGEQPFILVTSAYHMPRAVRLFETAGGRPVAAPTGQRVVASGMRGWHSFIPSSAGLKKAERALHEYLGLLAISWGIH